MFYGITFLSRNEIYLLHNKIICTGLFGFVLYTYKRYFCLHELYIYLIELELKNLVKVKNENVSHSIVS